MNDSGVGLKPRSTIQAEIDRLAASRGPDAKADMGGVEAEERSDPLPRPGDAYLPHARRTAKPQMTLFFMQKDFMPDGYSYANLERVRMVDSDKQGSGPVLVVRFSGSVVTEVTIEGRHLYPLCNAIGMHLMNWVWEHPQPNDFGDETATFIRKISFNHTSP